ncbi:Ankyrin repeat protein [Pandoravirus kuranda]|uniref:Ankyrin repeat protein n=1 Tax=Pandoravirus kuranda TaxID=3019033 RepID=A0AA95ECF7_9VIRU|nr:Ankyrin repeat protein [Pandoravirus kuranda]
MEPTVHKRPRTAEANHETTKGGRKRCRRIEATHDEDMAPHSPCDALVVLPDEMVAHILWHVPCLDRVVRVRLVARRYAAIADDDAALGHTLCIGSTPPTESDRMIDRAAAAGHVACVEHAIAKGQRPLARTFCAAATGGHLAVLKMLSRQEALPPPAPMVALIGAPAWDECACSAAASSGHLDCLAFLHDNGCPWDAWTLVAADCNGHVDCGDYARARGCPEEPPRICSARDIARCTHEHRLLGSDWRPPVDPLSDPDHVGGIFYDYQHGLASEAGLCLRAARHGHMSFLVYAKACGMHWDASACDAAAIERRLDCLRYLHEQGCPWDTRAVRAGITSRCRATFAYLRDHGCPADDGAVVQELSEPDARLDVVTDLCERMGCSVTDEAVCAAVSAGRADLLAYLHQRGGRLKAEYREKAIIDANSVDCLRYICENGHPPDAGVLCAAAAYGTIECVRYLFEIDCPWHPDALFFAQIRGNRETVDYLEAHKPHS